MTASNPPQWWLRFKAELRADPKKATILGILVLVGAVVGLRQVMKTPASAQAARPAAAQPAARPAVMAGRVQHDGDAQSRRRDEYIQNADRTISRDLFAIDPGLYPNAGGEAVAVPAEPIEDSQEQLARALMAKAASLELQSIIVGAEATAVINGAVVRVGDQIGEFTVASITADSCQLEARGIRVTRKLVE